VSRFFQAFYAAPQSLGLGFEPVPHLANFIKHFAAIRLDCFRPGLHVCKALGFSLNFENCRVDSLKIGGLLIAGLGLADTESLR
jgi:hypothetical protein